MVYFNRTGAEFLPAGSLGVNRGLQFNPPETIAQDRGLYFRSRIFDGLIKTVDACMSGELPFSDLSLDAYQVLVERGWKAQHGTYEAAKRWYNKGHEEVNELDQAIDDYSEAEWSPAEVKTALIDHVIEECGDNLFIAVARSSNSGNVSSDSVKAHAYDYAVGTKVKLDSSSGFTEPDWYDAAAELAIKKGSPTIGDIDDLLRNGFVPRFSAAMNLYEEEEISLHAAVLDLRMYAIASANMNMQQFGYGEATSIVSAGQFELLAGEIGKMTAETYFKVGAIAHYVGRTLADVVAMNIAKVSDRVETRTVDKSDRLRTT